MDLNLQIDLRRLMELRCKLLILLEPAPGLEPGTY